MQTQLQKPAQAANLAPRSAGMWNRRIGWASTACGAVTGLVLGLWSFDGPVPIPDWLGPYDATGRRLARLGHIAFFGLGILNLLLARDLARMRFSDKARRYCAGLMNFGNIGLPLALFVAAAWRPFKYAMSIPATAVAIALLLAAIGMWQRNGMDDRGPGTGDG